MILHRRLAIETADAGLRLDHLASDELGHTEAQRRSIRQVNKGCN